MFGQVLAPAPTIPEFIALQKNLLLMNARELSAGAGLGTLWSDDFKDSSQINAGASSGYSYRGTPNFDVIVNPGGTKETQATKSSLAAEIMSNVAAQERGVGHAFTAASSYTLASVKFNLLRLGSPTGNLRAALYATAAGLPTGAALAISADLDVSTISTSATDYTFSFTVPYAVVSGTVYAVVLERNGAYSGNGANHINIFGSGSGSGDLQKSNADVWATGINSIYFVNTESAASNAVVQSVAITLSETVDEVIVFLNKTLNTGSITLVRVSANNGVTWKTVTNNLEEIVQLGHSGTQLILEVTFTGNAELEFWGVAAA